MKVSCGNVYLVAAFLRGVVFFSVFFDFRRKILDAYGLKKLVELLTDL